MIPPKASFIPVPNKKPMNEPVALFKALPLSLLLTIISPIKAPTKGPRIMLIKPKGLKIKPTNKPTVEPITPARVPPNFLVPQMGM
jgi:hypothetical protein